MAAPFVATSRLSNIIQMITLSGQTGILRAIRGQGATRELGQIRFIDGEPVAALLGHLTGAAALNTLSNWGECQYAFDELTIAEAAGGYAGYPSSNPTNTRLGVDVRSMSGRHPSTTPLSDFSWPVYGYQQSGPLSDAAFGGLADLAALAASGPQNGPSPAPSYSPPAYSPAPYSAPPYSPSPYSPPPYSAPYSPPPYSAPSPQPYTAQPYGPQPYTAPYTAPAQPYGPPTTANGPVGPGGGYDGGQPAVATGLLQVTPQRTAVAEQIDQLPLDRRERMVLLLVDGQRTVADLARLTRRTEPELQSVLSHLHLLGLVRFGG